MRYFSCLLKNIPFNKLVNIVLLTSLLLTSCTMPLKPSIEVGDQQSVGRAFYWNTYTIPTFTRPTANTGTHTEQNFVPVFPEIVEAPVQDGEEVFTNDAYFVQEMEVAPNASNINGTGNLVIAPVIPIEESYSNTFPKVDPKLVPINNFINQYISDDRKILIDGENTNLGLVTEYNSVQDEVLIVWVNGETNSFEGRLISPEGELLGEKIFIENVDQAHKIKLTYSSESDSYLLTWISTNEGVSNEEYCNQYYCVTIDQHETDLYALSISGDLQTIGSPILITSQLTTAHEASLMIQEVYNIAYNSIDDKFLIAWQQDRGGIHDLIYVSANHVMLQQLNTNGSPVGAAISVPGIMDSDISLAYNSNANTYLLVYSRWGFSCYSCGSNGYYALWSKEISGDLNQVGIERLLASSIGGHNTLADIAYSPSINAYQVVWWNTYNYYPQWQGDIYTIKTSAQGVPSSILKIDTNLNPNGPQLAYNSYLNQFFVWTGLEEGGIDNYGISHGIYLDPQTNQFNRIVLSDEGGAKISAVSSAMMASWISAWIFGGRVYAMFTLPVSSPSSLALNNDCAASEECLLGAQSNATGQWGKPINTKTGGMYYQTTDISVPTSLGELRFFRTYSSLAIDLYASNLGFGWTNNLDSYLIQPSDSGGEDGKIFVKLHTANQYTFQIKPDGTYRPAAGVVGQLKFTNNLFLLKLPDQMEYIFDTNGRLLTRKDAMGHEWNYAYNLNGQIDQVSADSGGRYLDMSYDSLGRIIEVVDHTGRNVTYGYDENGNLISMTDVMGEVWTYEYDNAHRLTQVLDPLGNVLEKTEYDEQGRAIKQWDGEGNLLGTIIYNADGTTTIIDPFEHTQTHTYDSRLTLVSDEDGVGGKTQKSYDYNFRPTNITDAGDATTHLVWSEDGASLLGVIDAEGGQTDITYDSLNNPTSVIDPMGYLTTYEYDGTLLTSTTNALGQETSYTYTSGGFLESVTDPLGNTTTYTYDAYGQRTSMTDTLENTWTYAYDSLGRLIDTTDPLGRIQHNEYDIAGRLTRSIRNYDPNKSQNEDNLWNIVTEYEYDARGNQTSVIDTLGRETQYEYDAAGRLVKTIDPAGNETTNIYNEAGQLIATTDALGRETTYVYDATGRLVSTTDALDNTTSTIYNPDGTVASTSDALGRMTSFTYDDLKRVLTVTQPNEAVTTNVYDDNGNLISVTDALNQTTYYEYDALGRVIKTTDPLENFTENFYDDAGRLVQSIDARGNATTYEYDDAGRQISITDALGNSTSYEYDDLGRRTAVIDAAENRTEYTYDALDRVIAVTDPLGNTITTEYNALGQVIQRTDANGNETTFAYNALGQTTSQTDALGYVTSFAYDEVGNRLSATDARGSVTYTQYDALNRPVVAIDPLGNASSTTYDPAGQVVASTNANQETVAFTYTVSGQQETITDPLGNVITYEYDLLGRLISQTDANGIVTAYEYDALSRLTAVIENYKPGFEPNHEINVRTEYTYDENGNRLTITDGNDNTTTFTYDELNRLLTETDALGNEWSYAYDELGNRIAMTDANGAITSYDYDESRRLTGIEYADDNDVAFTYDAGGRRTEMTDGVGMTSWTYDELNRPTEITDPFGTTIVNVYDAVGNRVGMSYPNMDVEYVYDAANRLTTVYDRTKNTHYEYDPVGRLQKILRPNGVNSTYTYDSAGHLTQLRHATIESELSSFRYTYDNVGNRLQAVERSQIAGAGPTIRLTVVDTSGALQLGKAVQVYDGETETSYQTITDANGQAVFTLPVGSYRFRVEIDDVPFWSGEENHCTIGECRDLIIIVPEPVYVTVWDGENSIPDQEVFAYQDGQYTGYHGTTEADGGFLLRLPEGEYSFKTEYNGHEYWSEGVCLLPGCREATINVNPSVIVTVLDNLNLQQPGVEVVAFDGETETEYSGVTDENGQVQLNLPDESYRFRAEFNGAYYWSGTENHCTVPECLSATVNVILPVVVTVLDVAESPQAGLTVSAFDGETDTGLSAVTDEDGRAFIANLQAGDYRFKTTYNAVEYWSDVQDHCAIPECTGASITVGSMGFLPSTIFASVKPTTALHPVYALGQSPRPLLAPPNDVTVTVLNTAEEPQEGLTVYAFDGETYTGFSGITDSAGEVLFTLPDGNYHFSADLNGTAFWSAAENHCEVPGCDTADIVVTIPMTVTVANTDEAPQEGLEVQVFDGETFTGFSGITDASGEVNLTLPIGAYRFRTVVNGTYFWSHTENHCEMPGCESAAITVTKPVTVTVKDTDETSKEGVDVFAFDGETFTGYQGVTDANGEVQFTLPQGFYRFRADLSGTQFWSGEENHCTIPSCEEDVNLITVTKPILVTVLDENADPYAGFEVYAFDGFAPTGHHVLTDENGQAMLTLPFGEYRFAADIRGTLFWSWEENHCGVPGCEFVSVSIPGGYEYEEVTIDYTYDSLYRLTEASYSNGILYQYGYDAVGNRLSQNSYIYESESDFDYTYDAANRLVEVNEIGYMWDANGNLLSDGVNTYEYDSANRLINMYRIEQWGWGADYTYNGLGDRLTETAPIYPGSAVWDTTYYTLDLSAGLTQVLRASAQEGSDVMTYTYGLGRISQMNLQDPTPEYFLGDALGSVRQMTDQAGGITFARNYDPYGVVTYTDGTSQTEYGFTGEQYGDSTQLIYLRARYYNPADGRFQSRDTWGGDYNRPLSLNRWMYVEGNPINLLDPTGMKPQVSENWKYCSGLSGSDWKYCSNIIRGLHPETTMTAADYFLFDEYGPCYLSNLEERLPHSVYFGTWKEYGWWWHYLLDLTPGWWNDNGKGHIYFKDVLTFALAAELSTAIDTFPDIVGYAAGAFANKGRNDGFYKMIGSRQSVYWRVNNAVYGAMSPELGVPYNFAEFGSRFGAEINNVAVNVLKIRGWGNTILSNTGFTPEQNLAYEWGNPTQYSRDNFPKLMAALQRPDTGTSIDQVLWYSDDRMAFVVSQAQLANLCGGGSCVAEDLDN